jgi:hypothetical protein
MKQIFNALKTLGIVVIMVFLSSCEKKYFVAPEEPIKDVSYTNDMQPFFEAKCTSCHNGTGIPLDLTTPDSYNNLIDGEYIDTNNPADSELYTKIIPGGSMEQYATPTEREMTLAWITEGAKDN